MADSECYLYCNRNLEDTGNGWRRGDTSVSDSERTLFGMVYYCPVKAELHEKKKLDTDLNELGILGPYFLFQSTICIFTQAAHHQWLP